MPYPSAACATPHLPHRFHWPSVYTGSVAPPVNGSSSNQVSEPVYWFVDMLAPFQVGAATTVACPHCCPHATLQ